MARPVKDYDKKHLIFAVIYNDHARAFLNQKDADDYYNQINASIDKEIQDATAESDKTIERLNQALEKAIERIEDIKNGYKIPTTNLGKPFDIIAEIRAIANGGNNDSK